MGLTIKQEKFAQKYIELGNASEAYRQAYDCKKMKQSTIQRNAKKLLKDNPITTHIEKLQEEHKERHNITVDTVTIMFLEDREGARKEKQYSAAMRGTEGIVKVHGLSNETIDHNLIVSWMEPHEEGTDSV